MSDMHEQISLNGAWLFKDFIGEDWLMRASHKPDTNDTLSWNTGTVPGGVHHDLWQNGKIPDPYFERNSLLMEWVPQRTWVYKKFFSLGADYRGRRVQLRFEGVDYEAQFFLNGEEIGAHRGMFTPVTFDISDLVLYEQENVLAVVIEPAPVEQPQVGETKRVRTHKSRMTYWWDFCPRMIQLGIWDRVFLEIDDDVRIQNILMRPQLSNDFQRADVHVELELDTTRDIRTDIEITIQREGNENIAVRERVARKLEEGQNSLDLVVPMEQPALWHPNGYGEPALYTVRVFVFENGAALVRRDVTFGIRRVELVPNENAEANARPYTFVVNGQKMYINGWNWVPLDVLYGVERPEKLEHLIELARRAHVNLLRVWGGGLIEKEAFYDLCDRAGIMVWQEFIQSSSGMDNTPPDDAAFIAMMQGEAEQIIPRKRNHPSLVVWCGGNELMNKEQQPADNRAPVLDALAYIVRRRDPDRFWFPTSPTGRVFLNSLENIAHDPQALHDVHGPWEYQGVTAQYALYNAGTSLFHSEFGAEGITNRKTLDRVIAREHQLPVSLENPFWFHLGAWWMKCNTWLECFGEMQDVESFVRATQFLQAEGVRYAIESNRRRMYHNSGSIPWQFNEPYPMAACTSAVDYYGNPKPLYYAVARAYAPLNITAKFETLAWAGHENFSAQIWSANAHAQNFSATCTMRLVDSHGQIYWGQRADVGVGANCAQTLGEITMPLSHLHEDVFFLDLELDSDENTMAQNRYVFTRTQNLAPLHAVPKTQLRTSTRRDESGKTVAVKNVGEWVALFVQLETERDQQGIYFSDNYFCLLPGESKTIRVDGKNAPSSERITAQGWNTENQSE